MSLRLEAIKPSRPVLDPGRIRAKVDAELADLAATVINKIAIYPPQEPTNYIRSGNLGRAWRITNRAPGRLDIVNNVVASQIRVRLKSGRVVTRRVQPRAYAVYVQGPSTTDPGQAQVMGDKGWNRIDDVAEEVFGDRTGIFVRILAGENA